MHIHWLPVWNTNLIMFSSQLFNQGVSLPSTVTLHFGAWKREVEVRFNDQLPHNAIGLPQHFESQVTIPEELSYDIYADGPNVHIGPVIAFLVTKKELSSELLQAYRVYYTNNPTVKGLIYLCSVQGINPNNKTVEGYYYNSLHNLNESPWIRAVFPYPDVTYRRTKINKNKQFDDLIVHTNHKVFNPYFLNKRELWQTLRSNPLIREHLPHTELLSSLQGLKAMLTKYESIYLKPTNGSMGDGIFKMSKTVQGYLFFHPERTRIRMKSESKVWALLKRLQRGRKYLIQQSVAMTYENKNVDFRIVMQKDGSQQWLCTGIMARYGLEGRFYTNDVSALSTGKEALRSVFHCNDEEADKKEEEIIKICSTACQLIEAKYGVFGDVGIDVTLDAQLKVWLLEINSRHQHNMASYLPDEQQMYQKVISRPFEYAQSWAGFTQDKIFN